MLTDSPANSCHDCGTRERVSVYDAGRVDRETGAADQIALCADCADTREVPTSAMVGERCPDCGLESCGCE